MGGAQLCKLVVSAKPGWHQLLSWLSCQQYPSPHDNDFRMSKTTCKSSTRKGWEKTRGGVPCPRHRAVSTWLLSLPLAWSKGKKSQVLERPPLPCPSYLFSYELWLLSVILLLLKRDGIPMRRAWTHVTSRVDFHVHETDTVSKHGGRTVPQLCHSPISH